MLKPSVEKREIRPGIRDALEGLFHGLARYGTETEACLSLGSRPLEITNVILKSDQTFRKWM